jgi:hypothetical protein
MQMVKLPTKSPSLPFLREGPWHCFSEELVSLEHDTWSYRAVHYILKLKRRNKQTGQVAFQPLHIVENNCISSVVKCTPAGPVTIGQLGDHYTKGLSVLIA